jgi:hypothetical protein
VERRYARLCAILALTLLLALPLREAGYGAGVLAVLLAAVPYTTASAAAPGRRLRRVYLAATVPAMLLNLKTAILGSGAATAAFGAAMIAAIVLVSAVAILVRLAGQERVTADTVLGGVCVYLLLGFGFSYVYSALESSWPGSFQEGGRLLREPVNVDHLIDRRPELNYFSFSTLTTVGFGDITPVSPVARVLSMAEAVLGQVYLTTFLAFLVGNHVGQRAEARRPAHPHQHAPEGGPGAVSRGAGSGAPGRGGTG